MLSDLIEAHMRAVSNFKVALDNLDAMSARFNEEYGDRFKSASLSTSNRGAPSNGRSSRSEYRKTTGREPTGARLGTLKKSAKGLVSGNADTRLARYLISDTPAADECMTRRCARAACA